jgi:hypothetical protein
MFLEQNLRPGVWFGRKHRPFRAVFQQQIFCGFDINPRQWKPGFAVKRNRHNSPSCRAGIG